MLLARFSRAAVAFKFVISLILAVGAVVFALSSPASSQTTPDLEGGFKPYGSYHGGDIDTVNLGTGNLTIHIPLLSYPQRGRLKLDYWLAYNAEAWHPQPLDQYGDTRYVYGPTTFPAPCATSGVTLVSSLSWCAQTVMESAATGFSGPPIPCVPAGIGGSLCPDVIDDGNPYNAPIWNVLTLVDPMGGSHQLAPTTPNLTHYVSVDTTGIRLDNPGLQLNNPLTGFSTSDGTRWGISTVTGPTGTFTGVTYGLGTEQDVYGNQVTVNTLGYNDSEGRLIPYPGAPQSGSGGCPGSSSTGVLTSTWPVPAYSGSATYLLCYTSQQISTNYTFAPQSADRHPYYVNGSQVVSLLTAVVLPGAVPTMWQFQYDSQGNLKKLTLPTGGSITYGWAAPAISCGSGTPLTFNQVVQSRTVDAADGSPPSVWTYAITQGQSTVTDPEGNDTVHTYPGGYMCQGYEGNVTSYQGKAASNVKLKSVDTQYSSQLNPGDQNFTLMNVFATQIKTSTFTSGGVTSSTVIRTPDAGEALYEPPVPSYSYSAIHGVDSEYSFDYGVTVPATGIAGASRSKTTVWQWEQNPAYLALGLMSMPASIKVADASGTVSETDYLYDEPSYSPGLVQGDPTTITAVNLTGITSSSPKTHTAWNNLGQKTASYDANLNSPTLYTYNASICGGSVLTSTTDPLGHTISGTYDCPSGLLISITDSNQNKTNFAYDVLSRITSATYPDDGSTGFVYDDANKVATRTIAASPDPDQTTKVAFDGLGRETHRYTADQTSQDTIDTSYDSLGRVASVTNPYRSTSDATYGVTATTYDALGRSVVQTLPDGAKRMTCYGGLAALNPTNCPAAGLSMPANLYSVDSTDESGNTWRRSSDSFGRLQQVLEPNPQGGAPLETDYTYDSLNNLLGVKQSGLVRSFRYNSLSQLIGSSNPETGVICYGTSAGVPTSLGSCNPDGYDLNGNLLTKVNAKGIVTSYTYDALNRLDLKTYSNDPTNTPPAMFGYDGFMPDGVTPAYGSANAVGRLSAATTPARTGQTYGYDNLGRLNAEGVCTLNDCSYGWSAWVAYDQAGNVYLQAHPNGRVTEQTFDNAGHLQTSILAGGFDISGPETLLQSATYDADGAVRKMLLGNGVVTVATTRNNRLQEQSLTVAGASNSTLPSRDFLLHYYCYFGTSDPNCVTQGTANNGNIAGIVDGLNSSLNQGFQYDALSRLTDFSLNGAAKQHYSIDVFGNMAQTINNVPVPVFDTVNPGTQHNRVTNLPCAAYNTPFYPVGHPYDVNGNLMCDTNSIYTYDAENRIHQVYSLNSATPAYTYVYNADGSRDRKVAADGSTTFYVDFKGQHIWESDWAVNTDSWFANGQRIASIPGYDNRLHTHGTFTAGGNELRWNLTVPANADGSAYVIVPGDMLCFRQYNSGGGVGGAAVGYQDGTSSGALNDTAGASLNQFGVQGAWVNRCGDISMAGAEAGAAPAWLSVVTDVQTAAGTWDMFYGDMTISSTDGTVRQVNLGSATVADFEGGNWAQAPVATYDRQGTSWNGDSLTTGVLQATTHFYADDHLGTAQMEFSSGGYPVWQGKFTPYGQELDSQTTQNTYKFTGKERDTESGLDYFGARYFSSNMGRWMSPDWSAKEDPVPYASLDNPQSLNLYGYVLNNPLSHADADGHCCDWLPDAVDYGVGVARGVASSVSFGLVGAPKSSDSMASLAGQLAGTGFAGTQGAQLAGDGAFEGGAALALAPETGGVSLGALADAGAKVAVGSIVATGAATNAGAIVVAMGKGSYTNTHESGKTYSGKGDEGRAADSAKRVEGQAGDKHVSTDHTTASSDRQSFKDEHQRIQQNGGAGSDKNYNKIESPGKKYGKQDGSN